MDTENIMVPLSEALKDYEGSITRLHNEIQQLREEQIKIYAYMGDQEAEIVALKRRVFELEFKNHCDGVKQEAYDPPTDPQAPGEYKP